MWATLNEFVVEFVTILLLLYVLVLWPLGMWDFISLSRDWIHTPCTGRRSLNHLTAREVPGLHYEGEVKRRKGKEHSDSSFSID